MLLKKLKLNYFGRFNNKEIELKPGINLICGDNEAGKSTLHTFIKGMFFGIERLRGRGAASKEDLYTRYLPWEYPGAFGGSMDIEVNGKDYRIQRSFHANDKSFAIIELSTGREVKLKEGMISELIPGLSESTFKNTISIEQLKAATDTELATQVRNYIANLSVAKSKEVNVTKAVKSLNEQRKLIEGTQNPMAIKTLQTEIEEGIATEARMDKLTLQLRDLLVQEQQWMEQKEKLSASLDQEATRRMEQLPAILEKYRSYQGIDQQINQLNSQMDELKKRIAEGERQQQVLEQLKEDRKHAETQRSELHELEKQESGLKQTVEITRRSGNKILYYSLLPAVLIAILVVALTGVQLVGILIAAICLLAGVGSYILINRKHQRSLQEAVNNHNQLTTRMTEAQNQIMDILTRYQVTNLEALADKQEELLRGFYTIENARKQIADIEQRKNEMIDSKDSLYDTIMTYLQYFIPVEELTSETMQRITDELRLRKQEGQDRQAEINKRYEECRLGLERIRWEISGLEGNEEQLIRNQKKLEQLIQQQSEGVIELEAIKLALSSIQELSAEIHDSFGHELNLAVSEIISEVTSKKYQDLKVDEKLEVKVGWNGDYVLLERLSAGTIDQVYFALRLAVADLLLGKDEVPLLLDDSFAMYDDTRVKAALTEAAKRSQILLFTCHKREQRLLEELQLPYHMVQLS